MIKYSTTTLQKQGVVVKDDITYNVIVTVTNNELTSLRCLVSKRVMKQHQDANGGLVEMPEDTHIGSIALEYGRRVIEFAHDVDVMPHVAEFQKIQDEVFAEKLKGK